MRSQVHVQSVHTIVSAPQVARSSAAPDPLAACRNTGSRRGGDQPRPAPPLPDEGAALRPPSLWGQEETLGRTGVWCGLPADAGWQPSPLGGSHVRRALRLYAADSYRMGGSASDCNKWQRSSMQLIPGYMLVWCACCGFCIMFAIMRDAESPRTVFDLLFTRDRSLCTEAEGAGGHGSSEILGIHHAGAHNAGMRQALTANCSGF